jgi:hypothetical protein
MNRCLVVLAFLFGLAGLAAQEPAKDPAAAEKLQQLIRDLRAIDAATWTARLSALEAQAKARDAEAATLRQQAKELEQRAAAADAEAKTLRGEMARIDELRKLLATLPATNPAPADAPKPSAEPQKMQPNAPDAGKPTPPKVEPKVEPKAEPKVESTGAAAPASMAAGSKDHGELITWARVSTIFADHCTSCHDPTEQKGGLDLTTFAVRAQRRWFRPIDRGRRARSEPALPHGDAAGAAVHAAQRRPARQGATRAAAHVDRAGRR